MKQNGLNVYTLNMNHEERDVQSALEDYIQKYDIGMVLTGGLSFQYNAIKEILDYDSAIVTVAGGGIITSAPEAGMEVLEFADYGIIGEGEETTPALCRAVAEGSNPKSVNGLIIDPRTRCSPCTMVVPLSISRKCPKRRWTGAQNRL